jgi:hypothetical protein
MVMAFSQFVVESVPVGVTVALLVCAWMQRYHVPKVPELKKTTSLNW